MKYNARIVLNLEDEWLFHLGDIENGQDPKLNDEEWKEVEIPHDWSIEGKFKQIRDENWFFFQNLDHRIGYLPQGIGWYRKHIFIPKEYENKKIIILFDGIYRDSDVWINGAHLGHRMYGYISFYYDLTPHIKFGQENILAVRVDNKGVSSRWYSGSGIYRKVRLIIKDEINIAQWGIFAKTTEISNSNSAKINLRISINNQAEDFKDGKLNKNILFASSFFPIPFGKTYREIENLDLNSMEAVSKAETKFPLKYGENTIEQNLNIKDPMLWSPDAPNLYIIKTELILDNKVIDEEYTKFGIRTFKFDPNEGFFLNGKNYKFKGVCLHHDNGPLGSKIYVRAVERKLEIMKEMGCNTIRTSHNPPSEELLDLCDLMGFLVMDEAFDEWTIPKTPYGYTRVFEQDYEKDVTDFVRRDRNHPSVIIWSCGNEVPEQKYKDKLDVLKKLLDVFHREDPTRPVTQGCNMIKYANETGFADMLDIVGYNYYGDRVIGIGDNIFKCMYDLEHEKYPNRVMIGSENCSALNTRGVYHFPLVYTREGKKHEDYHCSSYDVTSEIPLLILKTRPYVCGMFTWEGFDYIGEPSPYNWPARSSQFGLVDLCGFPKDNYYLYKSQWTSEPMIHVFPHWNWKKGMKIPVWVYTNCDEAELFLNGKSLGKKSLNDEEYNDVLHLEWEVDYEPGELKAIGIINGKNVCSKVVKTAKEPSKIKLSVDRNKIHKHRDLAYIKVEILDEDGVFMPTAENLINFTIKGPGKIIGVGNGNPISHELFVDEQRHAFNGLCLAIISSIDEEGIIEVKATSPYLKSDTIKIEVIK
ncbi:MAG: glycoside hydrolase family 2 TIM barrel-domain containing protein [Promethearchaeota archaeon]